MARMPRQEIAFAVVVAVGDHRAVHVDQHGVERHRRLHAGQDLVAEAFIDRAHRRPRRRGEGAEALDHGPAALLGFAAPDMDRRGEVGRLVLGRVARQMPCSW
jgi:hypothetical protein